MFAKLTLYPDRPTQESSAEIISPRISTPSDGLRNWQLVADNLTTGKVMELLMCLDELGFLSDATDGLAIE
jgi:hypothetical protein